MSMNIQIKQEKGKSMINQFSSKVSEILVFSKEEANRLSSNWVGPEHLLLGMLREKANPLIGLFFKLNIDTDTIKAEIEDSVRHKNDSNMSLSEEPALDEQANNILKLAVLEARIQHSVTVDVEHVLLAILHDQSDNGAREILERNSIDYNEALDFLRKKNAISNGIELSDDEDTELSDNGRNAQGNASGTTTSAKKPKSATPVLDNFSTDLTMAAAEGKLDVVVGRDAEIQRVIEILCRRKKNNPILIGEPGVGKSAIAEGLAQMIAKRHVSPVLFNKRIVSLDMTAIVAGTKYRGQFEERIHALLKEIENDKDVIVFIDEIHTLIGAGSTPGSMDAANIMKPALARGVIQCIGATTLDEYRKSIEKDGALERRFQKVMINPTSKEETLTILNNIKERYEQHHHVCYTESAIEACVNLTDRYITDRCFPDKAIDALDEVGSKVHIQHAKIPSAVIEKEKEISQVEKDKRNAVASQQFELAASLRDKQTRLEKELQALNDNWSYSDNEHRENVTESDVADVVSIMSGVPVQRMTESEHARLRRLGPELKQKIISQDEAIDKIVACVQRNRMGLRDPNKPIGVFMFLGPTGVGKTHLAKQLSELMFGSKDALIRLDMSEYTESFNTSRLIGAPPGYVGYDEGGQLTEKVRHHPYSIVLLDEIEKANGSVFNLLLQVLDEGRLTDGNGRIVDFRNTIIIMTSNVGTRSLKDFGRGIGFRSEDSDSIQSENDKKNATALIKKELSKRFSPEFLNRFDEIITFKSLDMNALKKIVNIELESLIKRISDLGYSVRISDSAKEIIAKKGYDPQYGARPLKRAIQHYVEDGLCNMILSDEVHSGDTISIGKNPKKEDLTFKVVSNQ